MFWNICTWLYHIVKGLVKRAFHFVSASFIPKFHVWICHVVVYYISCECITIIGIIQWYLSLLYLQIHKQPVVCKMKKSGLLYSQQKHLVVHFVYGRTTKCEKVKIIHRKIMTRCDVMFLPVIIASLTSAFCCDLKFDRLKDRNQLSLANE